MAAKRISSTKYKRALEYMFARKIGAAKVSLVRGYLPDKCVYVAVEYPDGRQHIRQLRHTFNSAVGFNEYFGPCVYAGTWAMLAKRLKDGISRGEKFGWDNHASSSSVVFEDGDCIETALVEADLAGWKQDQ